MNMEDNGRLPPSPPSGDLANRLRAAREAAGHSLATMAALTHFSKPYLGHVETGHRHPTPDVIDRYEQVLGVPIGIPHDPVRTAHEWLCGNQPPAGRTPKTGRRLGTAQLRRLEARVIELRHRDDVVGSRELLPVVRAELDAVCRLADEAVCTDRLGTRLHVVIAELAQLVGWIASDAGHYRHAEQAYLTGAAAADTAGDRVLGGQLLSSLAYQITNIGKREDGLLIAKTAVAGATDATPVARALLLERLAWAAARCHDSDTCRRTLDAVDDAYDQCSPGITEPEWVYWLNRAEIDVMAARCHIQLGQPAAAEPLLTRALADYNPDHVREVGLYQTWLAEGYARTGNHDAARHILDQINTSAVDAGSVRLQRRIDAVTRLTTTGSH
ncbi:helix-turn-helix domain-containing protein [Micromonospora sp. NPDC049275]|uniref:helix-turn-helix domain-containing protein n=1 Tax=Micromonospora sp. NPDC049275 TaxID=3364268 RepID=UPI00371ABB84